MAKPSPFALRPNVLDHSKGNFPLRCPECHIDFLRHQSPTPISMTTVSVKCPSCLEFLPTWNRKISDDAYLTSHHRFEPAEPEGSTKVQIVTIDVIEKNSTGTATDRGSRGSSSSSSSSETWPCSSCTQQAIAAWAEFRRTKILDKTGRKAS